MLPALCWPLTHFLLEQIRAEIIFCVLCLGTLIDRKGTGPAFYETSLFKCYVSCSPLGDYTEQIIVQNHGAHTLLNLTSLICIFKLNVQSNGLRWFYKYAWFNVITISNRTFIEMSFFINMIWVFEEHLVLSESVNYRCVWIMRSHIFPGLASWAASRKKTGFLKFHLWLSLAFFFVPLLSHTCFAALTIKPSNGEHTTTDTRSNQAALPPAQAARRGEQKALLPLQSSSHKAETRGMSTANSPTTLPWAAGKGLQHPLDS